MKKVTIALFLLGTFSASAQYDATFDPTVLNGQNGFRITPTSTSHTRLGHATSFIGDINNDGFDDIALGDDFDPGDGSVIRPGKVFIVFGKGSAMPGDFDLAGIDGTNGFVIQGKLEEDRLGEVISDIGDVNGDNIDDFITIDNRGAIIIYGRTTPFPAVIERTDIDGTNGFLINKTGMTSVANAGDHNGDGKNDFIIGVPHWDEDAWILFGRSTNFPATIDASYLDGTKGYIATNFNKGSRPAYVVSGLGDINNDGYDDVMVGAWTNSWDATDIQMSYLIYGHAAPFTRTVDLDNSTASTAVQVSNEGNGFISHTSGIGDINNDGIDDFISDGNVFFGSTTPYLRVLSKTSLNGTNGFHLPRYANAAPIGDFNQDGIDDCIIDGQLILFGKSTPFTDSLTLSYFDGVNGFKFNLDWSDNPGSDGLGDFNGDGYADIVTRKMVIFGGKNISKTTTSSKQAVSTENSITIYPNPTAGLLHMDSKASISDGDLSIISYDGTVLLEKKFTGNNTTIDVSYLENGLYIIRIITPESGEQRTKFNKF